jgi:hypothetical protein
MRVMARVVAVLPVIVIAISAKLVVGAAVRP